ncbi:DNA-processing protein DprA [Desulfurobacterium atlanticum]|uniref:DNA processing protein n=1 Tax=Desulfurobacterium atlanticum TaxID=240169 RepID=A0A238Y335_9BACT|nr:DNA-processing protein DprA [Desulfurobacterium atlanticum]SNR65382.1 DNA processing protein [Desulfurobacterium atlanticum]
MDKETLYALGFYLKRGIGFKTIERIICEFGSFEIAYKSGKFEPDLDRARAEIEKAEKLRVSIIPITSPDYPSQLKTIPHPPPIIYVKGEIGKSSAVAIVGSRKCSSYGRKIAYQLAKFLSSHEIAVVSGLAYGIDTAAHKGAVESDGITYAVLGCGIDVDYPAGNSNLRKAIIEKGGAVISEFPFGTSPSRENFPRRNRIISGLALATVVIEANENSGALITAQFTVEQGRELFVVPANVDSIYSRGSNRLLRAGATPLTDFEQIFEDLPYLKQSSQKKINKVEIDEAYQPIINVLLKGDAHIDKIIAESGLSYCEAITLLFEMESKGIVKSENNRYFLSETGGMF